MTLEPAQLPFPHPQPTCPAGPARRARPGQTGGSTAAFCAAEAPAADPAAQHWRRTAPRRWLRWAGRRAAAAAAPPPRPVRRLAGPPWHPARPALLLGLQDMGGKVVRLGAMRAVTDPQPKIPDARCDLAVQGAAREAGKIALHKHIFPPKLKFKHHSSCAVYLPDASHAGLAAQAAP